MLPIIQANQLTCTSAPEANEHIDEAESRQSNQAA